MASEDNMEDVYYSIRRYGDLKSITSPPSREDEELLTRMRELYSRQALERRERIHGIRRFRL